MTQMSRRINSPISTKELERRGGVIRFAMQEHGIDVL